MPGVEVRGFDSPDDTRTGEKSIIEIVKLAGTEIGRYTLQPGWRWSEVMKPIVKTDSCQVEHLGYVVSGTLHVEHEDGTVADLTPGSVYRISPVHYGSAAGNEPVVLVEFQGAAHYGEG